MSNNTNFLGKTEIDNEAYFVIPNVDKMRPFFMSVVSDANHWMFIGSNGGLSAGRKDSEYALFPYYTDDKIIESVETTGSKSVFLVEKDGKTHVWEPFSIRFSSHYSLERNLYKNVYGNKILFEEINHDLGLVFRYQWNTSKIYGFVRKCTLENLSSEVKKVQVLDGIQNIVPYGVGSAFQNQTSNLVNAYKRNELMKGSGIGVYALSAIVVDKAEPSEALKANTVWSLGLGGATHLLSSLQLEAFRNQKTINGESDVKGHSGAYFLVKEIMLEAKSSERWMFVADVNKSISAVIALSEEIKNSADLESKIDAEIEAGVQGLVKLNACADALQLTNDPLKDARHFSNSLFNIMRGGIADNNYQIEKNDLKKHLQNANSQAFTEFESKLDELPDAFPLTELKELTASTGDATLMRLCAEYLPFKFSRRHGDPSRPWNKFSINTHSEQDGSKILDYEGNWRDIFQNWEALAHSFPEFIEGKIFRFLNASTFDGYNPYRITKNGIDWEKIEPDDPWSYIGYWGDHQIIYLLKFLEFAETHYPGKLAGLFSKELFVYANVPYRIKSYKELLANPKDTIDFDQESEDQIAERWKKLGADAALLCDQNGEILKVNFIEKVLASVLAKVSNFIPEGGIWMNTQRPEWNDANNALVGNGVSMVTLGYLLRFLSFFEKVLQNSTTEKIAISKELKTFFEQVVDVLENNKSVLNGKINDVDRKNILDGLGEAGSAYRLQVYANSLEGTKHEIEVSDLLNFTALGLQYAKHTVTANKRPDNLYHAYNLMSVDGDKVTVSHLSEMLEGQVSVLSSGFLSAAEALEVLDALRESKLFREDQSSYLLYPDKDLLGFSEKNNIPSASVENSPLLKKLLVEGDQSIIEKDVKGGFHFNGSFRNANDLSRALLALSNTKFASLAMSEADQLLEVFEEVFNHKAFTGRSGTFFGYEGLGSIYWHMVSKLAVATQEVCKKAIEEKENSELVNKLLAHYYEIVEGLGLHKPPSLYGAFPTDPYSHTPAGKGAQQPGMTGQVKEDILCRFGELGIEIKDGKLGFNPSMLKKEELLTTTQMFEYVDVNGDWNLVKVEKDMLCFTYCQVPVIYQKANKNKLEVFLQDGSAHTSDELSLNEALSSEVFKRTGYVAKIIAQVEESIFC